jgi:DNA topoisomerase VI subunit A
MSKYDIKKCNDLLQWPFIRNSVAYKNELLDMIDLGKKLEIEALYHIDINVVSNFFQNLIFNNDGI